jgi:hypothetical protein
MVRDFCKNDLTSYFQNAIKLIALIITNQVQGPYLEVAHLNTPLSHNRHHRHIGIWTPQKCPSWGVRARNLFQTIGQAEDGEDQAVPPIQDPRAVGPNHRRHVEPHPPLATIADRKKIQDAIVTSQKKDHKQP